MVPKKSNFSDELNTFMYGSCAIFILLLSLFNLQNIKTRRENQVLGTTDNTVFWEELSKKHPTYKDAWIELGRIDKVRQIDPNFSRLP